MLQFLLTCAEKMLCTNFDELWTNFFGCSQRPNLTDGSSLVAGHESQVARLTVSVSQGAAFER